MTTKNVIFVRIKIRLKLAPRRINKPGLYLTTTKNVDLLLVLTVCHITGYPF
jgi:hypothetical protein